MSRLSILVLALVAVCCAPGAPEAPPAPLTPETVPAPPEAGDGYTVEERMAILGSFIQHLAETLPADAPVYIGLGDLRGEYYGLTAWDDELGGYAIALEETLEMSALLETMAHEWAHALAWRIVGQSDHGPAWGLCYSQTYEALLSWDAGLGD